MRMILRQVTDLVEGGVVDEREYEDATPFERLSASGRTSRGGQVQNWAVLTRLFNPATESKSLVLA